MGEDLPDGSPVGEVLLDGSLVGEVLVGEGLMGEDELEAEAEGLVGSAQAGDLALCLRVDVDVAAAPGTEDVASEGMYCSSSPLAESDEYPPSPFSYLSRAQECQRLPVGPVGNKRSARCAHMTSSCDGDH